MGGDGGGDQGQGASPPSRWLAVGDAARVFSQKADVESRA
jgi:hypothetical protein